MAGAGDEAARGGAGRAWQTRERDDAKGAARDPLAPRLIRVLGYDDLGGGGGPAIDLDGVSEVHLGGGELSITRERRSIDVRTPDPYMSARHARVKLGADGRVTVEDLGSRNGTYVAGGLLRGAALPDGTWFETGRTVWMVRWAPRGVALETPLGPTKSFSPQMASVAARLARLAPSKVPLVLAGPTGAGKEVLAREVHRTSGRAGELVAVNCGGIVDTLLESELFGHVKGAFTGAASDRRGYVEAAHLGTLFLDEVSDLPLGAQVRLLRVLEVGEVVPVGAVAPRPVDLRVLSASNRDLEDLVDEGRFRMDLYARLAGYNLVLPPLAARREDLGELVGHFVRSSGRATAAIEPEAGRALLEDEWPLNVRGLRRAIESALVLAADRPIRTADLPQRRQAKQSEEARPTPAKPLSESDQRLRDEIIEALRAEGGNVTRAAERMGKHRQQFQRWIRRLEIDREPEAGKRR